MFRLRMDFVMVVYGSCLYVFGGFIEQFVIMDFVECYNVKINIWIEMLFLLMVFNFFVVFIVERKVYFFGGVSQDC